MEATRLGVEVQEVDGIMGMLGTRLATSSPPVPSVIRCPIKAPRPSRPGKQTLM